MPFRHCSPAFMKHVLPRLLRPHTPGMRDPCQCACGRYEQSVDHRMGARVGCLSRMRAPEYAPSRMSRLLRKTLKKCKQ